LVADDGFVTIVGFSDEDRILMENVYIFKGYGAKTLLRNFGINTGDCGD